MGLAVVSLDDAVHHPRRGVALTFDDGYRDTYTTAFPLLAERSLTATVYVVTGFVSTDAWFEPGGGAMTWAMLREMMRAGWDIGSHTVSHRRLVNLPRGELRAELRDSRAVLEDRLGLPCRHFCAPAGDMDLVVLEEALASGYETAALSVPPRHLVPARHPAVIWRSGVYRETTWLAYRIKARGWDRWLRGPWW